MINLSFSGCGFLGIYHLGVASCFKTYVPHLCFEKASGASAGAVAATLLLGDVDFGDCASGIIQGSVKARERALGPFSPSFNINQALYDVLNPMLPDDIHERVNGRLHVSLTSVYDGKNILVNQFASRDELIQVVLASCFIPIFSGWLPPRYRGVRVIDGGYSDNLPMLNTNTITVSPFAGDSDICPQDNVWTALQVDVSNQLMDLSVHNFVRLGKIFLPPEPEMMAKLCKQGFDDTLRFLQNKYMISCTLCLTLQSTYQELDDTGHDLGENGACHEYDPDCLDCKLQRVAADNSQPQLWQTLENAKTLAEARLSSWYLISLGAKTIKLLSKPVTLPINIAYRFTTNLATLTGILDPDLKLNKTIKTYIDQMYLYVSKGANDITNDLPHTAKYTCEFSIKQYGENENDEDQHSDDTKDLLNLALTTHIQSNPSNVFPQNKEEALQFQANNLEAAVESRCHSRVVSRAGSRTVSRMGSRKGSVSNLANLGGESPDTIEQIKSVIEASKPVMSLFYTDSENQVKVTEIFDMTNTDPSLLDQDKFGINYDIEQTSATPNFSSRRVSATGATALIRAISQQIFFEDHDSDPEADWKVNNPNSSQIPRKLLPKAVSFANITTM